MKLKLLKNVEIKKSLNSSYLKWNVSFSEINQNSEIIRKYICICDSPDIIIKAYILANSIKFKNSSISQPIVSYKTQINNTNTIFIN